MMNKCKTCIYKGFREMIKKPFGYSEEIPCLTCKWYSTVEDNYIEAKEQSLKEATNE